MSSISGIIGLESGLRSLIAVLRLCVVIVLVRVEFLGRPTRRVEQLGMKGSSCQKARGFSVMSMHR